MPVSSRPSGMPDAVRLPGIYFDTRSPQLEEILPRMDIAVFVGFAACGPLDTPVAIEDPAQFTALFGPDQALAWDTARGELIYAQLAPAVRAFFQNGGRRCWVIRVAGEACTNQFPLPDILCWDSSGQLQPAFARARSAGSWSDGLKVSTALQAEPLGIANFSPGSLWLDVIPLYSGQAAAGDLVRLSFRQNGKLTYTALLPIKACLTSKDSGELTSPLSSPAAVRMQADRAIWFQMDWSQAGSPPPDLLGPALNACLYQAGGETAFPILAGPTLRGDGPTVEIDLDLPLSEAPASGSFLRIGLEEGDLWLIVAAAQETATGSPSTSRLRLSGPAFLRLPAAPSMRGLEWIAERLTFSLQASFTQPASAYPGEILQARLDNLGFTPENIRYWASLPADEALYAPPALVPQQPSPYQDLQSEAANPRFPLAGPEADQPQNLPDSFPLGMDLFFGPSLPPDLPAGEAMERDGLAKFSSTLFLDPDLLGVTTAALQAEADYLRYGSPFPRQLKGIHAALSIDEATLICVPDAVQPGWERPPAEAALPPGPSLPLPRPDWWHFLDCGAPGPIPLVHEPEWDHFLDCGLRILPVPELSASQPDPSGTFSLIWTEQPGSEVTYVLQELSQPVFDQVEARDLYSGPETSLTLYGRVPGDYYYRVRAVADGQSSDWSEQVGVRVPPPSQWRMLPEDSYEVGLPEDPHHQLLAVHRALLRLCAARGDLLAVLCLPEHFRSMEVLSHLASLQGSCPDPIPVPGQAFIPPLDASEANDFSFAALYHPWLEGNDEGTSESLRRYPPDGPACGILARRALQRGAWIAPANEPLEGVAALEPDFSKDTWLAMQSAQVNLIRHDPRGFLTLNADTLSLDEDLRPIGVRRLLILLRRAALRRGANYVFEPNDSSLARMVERGFGDLLHLMFARGAFAGATPDSSYQVVVDISQNDLDNGRFIVDLKVAPSWPMRYLTVRLVQAAEQGQVMEIL